jgi:hypothetical protein
MRRLVSLWLLPVVACGSGPPVGGGGSAEGDFTIRFPLTPETCQSITSPSRGGSALEGVLVKVSGVAQIPRVEFYPDLHPCAAPGPDGNQSVRIAIHVPRNGTSRVSLTILGRRLSQTGLPFPASELESLPAAQRDPRVLFFDGEAEVGPEALRRGVLDIELHPIVNLLAGVEVGGRGVQARVTFYRPVQTCVTDALGAELVEVASFETSPEGRFFASIPYRASAGDCAAYTHGHEGFAFVETEDGQVALLVPGRAERIGEGLDPGMLLTSVRVLPRPPLPEGATLPVLTAVSRVPEGRRFVLYLSGFGLLRALPYAFELRRADGALVPMDLRLESPAGGERDQVFGPFDTYARFRRFGSSLPFVVRLVAYAGASPLELAPGSYRLEFGEPALRHRLSFDVVAP